MSILDTFFRYNYPVTSALDIVGGWASSLQHSQVAALWVDGQLTYLENKEKYPSVIHSIFIK